MQFQEGASDANALPFKIGKVLVMSDIREDDVRGNHAHYETEEILVALTGGCTVDIDDGKGLRESVRLSVQGGSGVVECGGKGDGECGSKGVEVCGCRDADDLTSTLHNSDTPIPNHSDTKAALLLYPHVWRTMRDFEPGTMLMVVANMKYDEADYIRDRAEFERIAETWDDLGGSAARSAGVSE